MLLGWAVSLSDKHEYLLAMFLFRLLLFCFFLFRLYMYLFSWIQKEIIFHLRVAECPVS